MFNRLILKENIFLFYLRTLQTLCLSLFVALPAAAHVFSASEIEIRFDRTGERVNLSMQLNLEAILAKIDPEVRDTSESPNAVEYDRLRRLPPEELNRLFTEFQDEFLANTQVLIDNKPIELSVFSVKADPVGDLSVARITSVEIVGKVPSAASTFAIGWNRDYGKMLLRTMSARQRNMHLEVVEKGAVSTEMVIDDIKLRTRGDMVKDFVRLGFSHILPKGLDHILFVVGIFLLSTSVRPILSQVTAFTVAHTVTLGLGTAGYVNLPASIVEPLIAASIVYVAVENIASPRLSPWRPLVVFGFGLLHGLGFAGILKDFAIPNDEFLVGLLSFNIGVELGQLAIIALCFASVGIWFGKKDWYRQRIVIPGSALIALIGAFWFVQRVSGLG
ncbi:MAG: HupE/UreJ family protein [Paracoccaceae bacterium]